MNKSFIDSIILSGLTESDPAELIQLVSPDEQGEFDQRFPDEISILPVRNTVLFPGVVLPITVGRQKSIKLVKKAYNGEKIIGVIAQKNIKTEDPNINDLYEVGTVARILKMLVLPDGNTTIIIQGQKRFKIDKIISDSPYLQAVVSYLEEEVLNPKKKNHSALVSSLKDAATKILKLNPEIPKEAQVALNNIENTHFLTHFLSSNINAEVADKQRLLEINGGMERATLLLEYMLRDIKMLEIKQEIHDKVNHDIDQQQRDYYLRQQIKVLQDELGYDSPDQELEELRLRGAKKKWPDEVAMHFNKELDKLGRMNPAAADYPVSLNYAELLVDLPWGDFTKDNFDLIRAQKILDSDHYGLEKVKERIIEYLAVLKLKNDLKGPILCLYGPPGVGKTSLGKSIAKALNRKYVRMSLGGVHDEAEIRGHRKTYIGSMPGKIIQNLKKVGASNPVFVLDEIDKVSSDFRGDPASALLEVLDPEQNSTFVDNYLEVDYDLSKVLFIATANTLDTIHPALRDRMEVIEVTGYTLEEKIQIAKKHLIPKLRKNHGLKASQINITSGALAQIINGYTRESGVRNLEQRLGKVIRRIAKHVAMEDDYKKKIDKTEVHKILGAEIFDNEYYQNNQIAGVVTGLAWTQAGGEILFIESSIYIGKGKLMLSGKLGEVMKESATAALTFLRANAKRYNIDYRLFDQYDLHIHVPAGAVPKDGPSAGITMLTSIASVFTQRKVKDRLAMTGEITLRGKVLPVGGIKEKVLAARRAGIQEIILCERNKKDIEEVDAEYIKDLTIHYVEHVTEVLDIALLDEKVPNPLELTIEENKTKN